MKIASREKVAGRSHNAAGKNWLFNPEPGTEAPMVCDVTDPAAQAIFLHERNANVFYALEAPSALTRGQAVKSPVDDLLKMPAEKLLAEFESIPGELLEALRKGESEGKQRKTVLAAIDARVEALKRPAPSDAAAQAALILGNDAATVVTILDSITDGPLLAEAMAQEKASANRPDVVAKLTQKTA